MINEFYKTITEWLLPLGYTEHYANHPAKEDREFHFIKDGIRVVCVSSFEEYCYLHSDILNHPYGISLKTGRYALGTNLLGELHNMMINNSNLLSYGKQ